MVDEFSTMGSPAKIGWTTRHRHDTPPDPGLACF